MLRSQQQQQLQQRLAARAACV